MGPACSLPSWEREADLQHFWRHILLYWSSETCHLRHGNRAYRAVRSLATHRERARTGGERYLAPGNNPLFLPALPCGTSLATACGLERLVAAEVPPTLSAFWMTPAPGPSTCLRTGILRRWMWSAVHGAWKYTVRARLARPIVGRSVCLRRPPAALGLTHHSLLQPAIPD